MKEKKYSVLSYNLNGYEIMHEVEPNAYEKMKDHVEFVYVTDDKTITSSTWTVVYVEPYEGDVFKACYDIRFNPFNYVHSDIVIRIDGSMGIVNDLQPIIDCFNNGNYDMAVMIHPTRNKMYDEYVAWCQQRGMKPESANKVLNFMAGNGYDVMNYRGLYQFNFMVHRKNEINLRFLQETYNVLKFLAIDGEEIHRCDQTVGSFVINTHYTNMKIMPVGQYTCNGMFFNWYQHKTNNRMDCSGYYDIDPFLFDRQVYFAPVWC